MSDRRELTRAEAVRLRRRRQLQKRASQPSVQLTRSLPLITSRQGYAYTDPAERGAAHSGTRRRYQASFTLSGFQIHMPTLVIPRLEAGWRLLSFFVSLLLAVAIYLAWTLPTFRATSATIAGNQRITADEINGALGAQGQPVFTLLPGELERRLRLSFPELLSAHVQVSLPNLITVSVTERQPLILWQQNGAYTWIDAQGVAMRPRGTAAGLITVSALATPPHGQPAESDTLSPVPYIPLDMVQAIQTLAPSVPAGATLTFDPRYGLGWTDARGWQAYFGTGAADMPLRLKVYQALVSSLVQRGIYPVFISVQYPNAPYYRLSQ
jgi:hypothetical protein